MRRDVGVLRQVMDSGVSFFCGDLMIILNQNKIFLSKRGSLSSWEYSHKDCLQRLHGRDTAAKLRHRPVFLRLHGVLQQECKQAVGSVWTGAHILRLWRRPRRRRTRRPHGCFQDLLGLIRVSLSWSKTESSHALVQLIYLSIPRSRLRRFDRDT